MTITKYRPCDKAFLLIVAFAMSLWCAQSRAAVDNDHFEIFAQPFEQPSVLKAFHQGNASLDGSEAVVPAGAPAQYQGKEPSSVGQRTTKKIYTLRLAIELESMMQQEWPKIMLPGNTVPLRDIVHTDVASVARVRMGSDNDVALVMTSKDAVDSVQAASTPAASLFDGDTSEVKRQAMATAELGQAVGAQARQDAALLRDALGAGGVDDFRKLYDGLSRYVPGGTSAR